jgi:phosphatidylglycerol:prolipoprotein diacylglycerol transferase
VHPIAFKVGSFSVHWYGVMMAVAFLLGLWTASRRGLRYGVDPEKVLDIGPWVIIGTIVGARALHVVTYWDTLMKDPLFPNAPWTEIFMVQRGGLVFYGGLIGASLACIIYVRFKKLPLWKMADVLAPSIALGYVFGRIGCFLNGCCYGAACDLPWAVRYPADSASQPPTHAVHPTQLYDSLLSLGLYLGLAWLYRRKKFDGQIFATYLMCYAMTRSIVETFRGDYTEEHLYGPLTPAHLISIGIFVAGITLYVVLRRSSTVKQG